MNYRFQMKCAALVTCAMFVVACESGMRSPVSPSAVVGGASALNADGSNLKVSVPLALSPLFEETNRSLKPQLVAKGSTGVYVQGASLSHRFQVSESESFADIVATGTGTSDAAGITRWTVDTDLKNDKRYVWRVRAEMGDAVGPWSNVMAFSTVKTGGGTVTTPSGGGTSTGPRPADPAPGTRLPFPDFSGLLFSGVGGDFSNSRSCPRGLKYVNNPWQDQVIDAFRQRDSRWGYNGKPTRTAADNSGVPVTAAGDEAAYHYGAGPDQGSFDVYLVDMLVSHCGSPSLTWRVFTGEEPGFWSGAGRF
jgi:hypothetical protein